MKKLLIAVLLLPLISFLVAQDSWADTMHQQELSDIWIYTGALVFRKTTYDELQRVAGEVSGVTLTRIKKIPTLQVSVELRGDTGSIRVLLGPQEYLNQQGFTIKAGDKVSVTGVKIVWKTKEKPVPVMIAHEVQKDGQVLKLRDYGGLPAWRGLGAP